MKIYKKYIIFVLLSILIFLSLIGFCNYIIDPYDIYNFLKIQNWNDKKPQINGKTRLHKTQKIFSNQYDCIFLGSSRIEAAFDFTENSSIFSYCKNYYNSGLSYPNILEIFYLVEMVSKYQKKPKLFIGLDFLQFNAKNIKFIKDINYYKKPFFIRYASLISYSILKDSLKTLKAKEDSFYKDNGAWKILENYLDKFPKDTNPYLLFLITEKSFYNNFYKDFSFNNESISSFHYFEKILDLSYTNFDEVYFFINPFHIRLLELLDNKIGYDQFEYWKTKLVEINIKKSKEWNKETYKIYDFSGFNSINTEYVDRKHQSKYFYDSSHIRPEFGEIIIKKILENQNLIPNFGVELNQGNIQSYLEEQRKLRNKWKEENKAIINEMIEFVKKDYKF